MRVERFPDASRFCEIAQPMLMRAECENNVILGKALAMSDEPRSPEHLLAIVFDGDEPVIAAMMTPPFPLIVTHGTDSAIDALGGFLHAGGVQIREVGGTEQASLRLAQALAHLRGQRMQLRDSLRNFQTDRVLAPAPARGAMRMARPEEQDLIVEWMDA